MANGNCRQEPATLASNETREGPAVVWPLPSLTRYPTMVRPTDALASIFSYCRYTDPG